MYVDDPYKNFIIRHDAKVILICIAMICMLDVVEGRRKMKYSLNNFYYELFTTFLFSVKPTKTAYVVLNTYTLPSN